MLIIFHTDPKFQEQARDGLAKQHDAGLKATVNRYNECRRVMLSLHGKGGVAPDAHVPEELSMEGIHRLDVDAELWLILDDDELTDFPGGKMPDWLVNIEVRRMIPHAQQIINCEEEIRRLGVESQNLAIYWVEQYRALKEALRTCTGKS